MSPFITCINVSTHFCQSRHDRTPHFVSSVRSWRSFPPLHLSQSHRCPRRPSFMSRKRYKSHIAKSGLCGVCSKMARSNFSVASMVFHKVWGLALSYFCEMPSLTAASLWVVCRLSLNELINLYYVYVTEQLGQLIRLCGLNDNTDAKLRNIGGMIPVVRGRRLTKLLHSVFIPISVSLGLLYRYSSKAVEDNRKLRPINICILPSKTQHMYIKALMKYQLHQGYIFRP